MSLDSPGSLFLPAYLYSGEHSSKPEWLIAEVANALGLPREVKQRACCSAAS